MRPPVDLSEVVVNYGLSSEPPPSNVATWFQGEAAKKGSSSGGGGGDDSVLRVSTATTMAGVLAQLWEGVMPRDETEALAPPQQAYIFFPQCEALAEPEMLSKLVDHLETCKDVCDHFGSSVMAFPLDPRAPLDHPAYGPVPGIMLRRFGSGGITPSVSSGSATAPATVSEESAIPADWEADPYWDDGAEDDEFAAMLAAARAADGQETDMANDGGVSGLTAEEFDALMDVPSDDEALVRVSREWVAAMIADMGVCPFTTSAAKAGLPLGEVHYPVSRVALGEEMYRDYWHEVALLESAPARSSARRCSSRRTSGCRTWRPSWRSRTRSTTHWGLRLEDSVQLVFFHPQWVFRDGRGGRAPTARATSRGAASFR